jgi:hypothetical protein
MRRLQVTERTESEKWQDLLLLLLQSRRLQLQPESLRRRRGDRCVLLRGEVNLG